MFDLNGFVRLFAATSTIRNLITFGYSEEVAQLAAERFASNFDAAIDWLSNEDVVREALEAKRAGKSDVVTPIAGRGRWQHNPVLANPTAAETLRRKSGIIATGVRRGGGGAGGAGGGFDESWEADGGDVDPDLPDNSGTSTFTPSVSMTPSVHTEGRLLRVSSAARVYTGQKTFLNRKGMVEIYRFGVNKGLRVEVKDAVFGKTTTILLEDDDVEALIVVSESCIE